MPKRTTTTTYTYRRQPSSALRQPPSPPSPPRSGTAPAPSPSTRRSNCCGIMVRRTMIIASSSVASLLLVFASCCPSMMATAFVVPTTTTTSRRPSTSATGSIFSSLSRRHGAFHPLFVSIGLGPQQQDNDQQQQQQKDSSTSGASTLVAGVDYVVPIHEDYRTSRRSKFDERCDHWFGQLLDSTEQGCLGPLAVKAKSDLLAKVPLINEIELEDRSDPDWTPYVSTKLPWTPLTPAYGLEQFGMPVPRRGAEAWRQFDVNGLVSQPYQTAMTLDGQQQLSESVLSIIQEQLESQGSWLNDDQCDGRLVYVNGAFVDALSKTTPDVYNLNSCPPIDSDLYRYLGRYTDGYTDELLDVDVPGVSEPLLSRLSGPNHKVGLPTSQFAINTQQGTACFTALNTLQVPNVAIVQSSTADDDASSRRPVLVVQAFTSDAGLAAASDAGAGGAATDADDDASPSALGNVRLLVVANDHSTLSVQQSQVDLDLSPSDRRHHVPKLVNSYTQIVAGASSNITYGLVNLLGGLVTPNVEADTDSDNDNEQEGVTSPRQLESMRPQLSDTVFNTIDAHVLRDASISYAGIQMGGCGRDRLAVSISLLQANARATINGFCLSGGAQRCETKTNVHHVSVDTECRQVQKNLVGGRSTTSFRGRIRVEQDAQRTDAAQLSRSVLLTDKARAWSVPSLEIIADDVKCSHGTTVSDLSEEELFYLTSRGIDRITARKLLMYAFASDVCQCVEPSFRTELERQALRRLENLVPQGTRAVKGEFQSI